MSEEEFFDEEEYYGEEEEEEEEEVIEEPPPPEPSPDYTGVLESIVFQLALIAQKMEINNFPLTVIAQSTQDMRQDISQFRLDYNNIQTNHNSIVSQRLAADIVRNQCLCDVRDDIRVLRERGEDFELGIVTNMACLRSGCAFDTALINKALKSAGWIDENGDLIE